MTLSSSRNPIGIVPIVWRGSDRSPESIVDDVASVGYRGIQSIDAVNDLEPFAARLRARELRVAEVYAALPATVDGPTSDAHQLGRARLQLLDDLDGDVLVAALDGTDDRDAWAGRASSPDAPRLAEAGMDGLAALLETLADETDRRGRRLAFHGHVGTYIETEQELDDLMARTNPRRVGLCLDVGHHLLGGGDPVAAIERHADRLSHVHLKDVDVDVLEATRSGQVPTFTAAVDRFVFCPLGDGGLDVEVVLQALDTVDYDGWLMVEQDSTAGDPLADSRRSISRLREHLRPSGT